MKRIVLAVAAMVACFSFVACTPALDHGTVTEKHYTPYKHWQTTGGYAYTCMPGWDGKMDCKYKYSPFVVEDHYQYECYGITFEADGREGDDCISANEYDAIKVGDHWGAS
jgi:hypothetical protein